MRIFNFDKFNKFNIFVLFIKFVKIDKSIKFVFNKLSIYIMILDNS